MGQIESKFFKSHPSCKNKFASIKAMLAQNYDLMADLRIHMGEVKAQIIHIEHIVLYTVQETFQYKERVQGHPNFSPHNLENLLPKKPNQIL